MTKSVIDLAAVHLKRQFLYQTQRGRFAQRIEERFELLAALAQRPVAEIDTTRRLQ